MTIAQIILRSTWGAQYGFGWSVRSLPATSIWLHHPVVNNLPRDATVEQERADMRRVEDIGRNRFRYADYVNGVEKWKLPEGSGISYSYVVYRSGRIYQGHRLDRFSSHTSGYNSTGIGIAVQGNTDLMDMTPEQVDAVARLLVRLKVDKVATQARLTGGHRDTGFATSCPGTHAYRRIAEINALAAQYEKALNVAPVKPQPQPLPQPDPAVRRAQAALNYLLGAGLAEDGWVGPLTNGADNQWRELDPDTPSMTPTTTYADYLEAAVNAIARLEKKIDALPEAAAVRVLGRVLPATGATVEGTIAGTNRVAHATRAMLLTQQAPDPAALASAVADELREELTAAVREAGGGATAEQIVDEYVARLTKEN